MLLEISGEITPERMKGWSQSKNNTQLWILYIENPKDTIRKLLELISEFSKVTVYKINTQISLAFLYTNSEKSEKLRNQSHSPLQRKIKYLGMT